MECKYPLTRDEGQVHHMTEYDEDYSNASGNVESFNAFHQGIEMNFVCVSVNMTLFTCRQAGESQENCLYSWFFIKSIFI